MTKPKSKIVPRSVRPSIKHPAVKRMLKQYQESTHAIRYEWRKNASQWYPQNYQSRLNEWRIWCEAMGNRRGLMKKFEASLNLDVYPFVKYEYVADGVAKFFVRRKTMSRTWQEGFIPEWARPQGWENRREWW